MSELSTPKQFPVNLKHEDTIAHNGRRFHQRDELKQQRAEINEGLEEVELGDRFFEDYYPESTEDWDDGEIDRMQYRLEEQGIVTMPRQDELAVIAEQLDISASEQHKILTKKRIQHDLRLKMIRERQVGVANIIGMVTTVIYNHPESTVDELMELVNSSWSNAHLRNVEIGAFKAAIESYCIKHKIVDEYMDLSPKELYRSCFDHAPKGAVEVEKSPMTLLLRCYDKYDYARAFYYSPNTIPQLSDKQIKHANSSGGLAFSNVSDPRLHGVIILENCTDWYYPYVARLVATHEQQHQINKLFSPVEFSLSHDYASSVLSNPDLSREQALSKFVTRFVRRERRRMGIDAMARDELIAYYADGRSIDRAVTILLTSDLYNYQEQYSARIGKISQGIQDSLALYLHVNRVVGDEFAPLVHKDTDISMVMPLINPAIEQVISRREGGGVRSTSRPLGWCY